MIPLPNPQSPVLCRFFAHVILSRSEGSLVHKTESSLRCGFAQDDNSYPFSADMYEDDLNKAGVTTVMFLGDRDHCATPARQVYCTCTF